MHPLHAYISEQLASQLKARQVVVWYDPRGEFQPFVDELRGGPRASSAPVKIAISGIDTHFVECAGSMFEVRMAVEPLVRADRAQMVVVYLPNQKRDHKGSVLMELEKAGATWEPVLKTLTRYELNKKFTQGVVDKMVAVERNVSYQDLARMAEAERGGEPPSILRSIFHEVRGNDALLAAWLTDAGRDAEIVEKQAIGELFKLIRARLKQEFAADAALPKLRAITLRYVLANEFRLDLSCDPPGNLESIPKPPNQKAEAAVRALAESLRKNYPESYPALADQVEAELGLKQAALEASALGKIDTFRFEERALLRHVGELIANTDFAGALEIVSQRDHSFWLDRDVGRKAQWEAVRRMAELGRFATAVKRSVKRQTGDSAAWLAAYVDQTDGEGWYLVDRAQRRLETWVATLDEEPEERPLNVVRQLHEDTCYAMAEGFSKALVKAGWTVPGVLHQTQIWSEVVTAQPRPVAYFFVDAMRFEMGVELADRLPKSTEVAVRGAVGSLPSITPIGMAALLPGASASFSVSERKGKLGASIGETFLPDLAARKKHAAAAVPKLVDVALDELLGLPPSKLKKRVDGAQVVLVRSQEIDHAGETGFNFQARQVMDTVIDNLARAIRKLAALGIEHAVVTADHGHLFFANDQNESMRSEAPGGASVELHRRCWIGRGGATPPGALRVSASSLGYASDLDFVFLASTGVFKAGGDLAFHHGGPSLQEMVIPVLTVRTKLRQSAPPSAGPISVGSLPAAITNRIFTVTLTFGEEQLSIGATGIQVRPLLIAAGRQVGNLGMVVDAAFDQASGCVTLEPSKPVTVAFWLRDDSAASVRVIVQDPLSDAELYRSPTDIPVSLLT